MAPWTRIVAMAAGAALSIAAATCAAEARAEGSGAPVRAVAGLFPPFVMEEQGRVTGFSVDLWNAVAARIGAPTTVALVADTPAAFDALRAGTADVVITGHFYTLERDREFDFTYSIMNAGQQVLVPAQGPGRLDAPLRTFLKLLFSKGALLWFASAFLLVLVPAHVLWFFGRKEGGVVPREGGYWNGIFHSLAWATDALLGDAPAEPPSKLGRAVTIFWRFAGVLFVSLLVAELTASLTVEQFRGIINGPDDLAGKVVATQTGSSTIEHLRRLDARVRTFAAPEEAYEALGRRDVDAVVLTAPALRHHEANRGAGVVKVVGPEFRKSDLGFVVALGSPLRRRIDTALVSLREDGTYERIRERWFGRD